MIVEKGPGVYCGLILKNKVTETVNECRSVLVASEYTGPFYTSDDDMVKSPGDIKTWLARHHDLCSTVVGGSQQLCNLGKNVPVAVLAAEPEAFGLASLADAVELQASVDIPLAFDVLVPVSVVAA